MQPIYIEVNSKILAEGNATGEEPMLTNDESDGMRSSQVRVLVSPTPHTGSIRWLSGPTTRTRTER